jgi:hypothetical protein
MRPWGFFKWFSPQEGKILCEELSGYLGAQGLVVSDTGKR